MVKKETCPTCRGNKVVKIERPDRDAHRSCPDCNGNGYKVSVVHLTR